MADVLHGNFDQPKNTEEKIKSLVYQYVDIINDPELSQSLARQIEGTELKNESVSVIETVREALLNEYDACKAKLDIATSANSPEQEIVEFAGAVAQAEERIRQLDKLKAQLAAEIVTRIEKERLTKMKKAS